MNSFVVLASVLACATAGGLQAYAGFPYAATSAFGYAHAPAVGYAAPAFGYAAAPAISYAHAPAVVAAPALKTQYHAQDELGQASYGYAHPGQAHAAHRDAAGNVRGSYAYVNPDGNEIRVNYVADAGGFRVESNALPQAPVHVLPGPLVGPAPVLDTPEVAAAKASHAAAHLEAAARAGRKKRGIIAAPAIGYASHGVHTYAYGATPASTYNSPTFAVAAAPAISYAAAPAISYAAAPAISYAAAPAISYAAAAPAISYAAPAAYGYQVAAAPVAYAAAPAVAYAHAPAAAVISAPAVREAVLTKVVNTPGHAVSYRVD